MIKFIIQQMSEITDWIEYIGEEFINVSSSMLSAFFQGVLIGLLALSCPIWIIPFQLWRDKKE